MAGTSDPPPYSSSEAVDSASGCIPATPSEAWKASQCSAEAQVQHASAVGTSSRSAAARLTVTEDTPSLPPELQYSPQS